jgi:hypothetical protein
MQTTTTATEYKPELAQYVGKSITDPALPAEIAEYYPVVNLETLIIEDFVFADEIDGYETAAIVDGEIKTGERYSDFVVRS